MKAIVILLDSLNRRLLDIYGAEEKAIAPYIDRLAARGVVFDNHWCGSAPCMPARRDMMTGRLDFLERRHAGVANEPLHLYDPALEAQCVQKLRRCMREHDSPPEQFVRLGL